AGFVAFLTALNTRPLAEGVNTLLGRPVLPLLRTDEWAIRRLVRVNAVLTFIFAFVYSLLPFGPLGSALVLGGIIVGAVWFLSRARTRRRGTTPLYTVERQPTDRAA